MSVRQVVVICLCCEAVSSILKTGMPRKAYSPRQTAFDVAYWTTLAMLVVSG